MKLFHLDMGKLSVVLTFLLLHPQYVTNNLIFQSNHSPWQMQPVFKNKKRTTVDLKCVTALSLLFGNSNTNHVLTLVCTSVGPRDPLGLLRSCPKAALNYVPRGPDLVVRCVLLSSTSVFAYFSPPNSINRPSTTWHLRFISLFYKKTKITH